MTGLAWSLFGIAPADSSMEGVALLCLAVAPSMAIGNLGFALRDALVGRTKRARWGFGWSVLALGIAILPALLAD